MKTKFSVVLLLSLLAVATTNGQNIVRQISMGGSSYAASFLNDSTGYVVGSVGTCSGVAHTYILRTTDGGLTWNDLYKCDTSRMRALHSLQMFDTTYGVSLRTFTDSRRSILRRTIDGGRSWIDIDSTRSSWVYYFNPQEGLLSSPLISAPLSETTDGGASWKVLDSTIRPSMGIQFVAGSDLGYAIVSSPTGWQLGRTTDRGHTWERLPLPKYPTKSDPATFKGVSFATAAVGYGWTNVNADTVGVFRTLDSGRTWSRMSSWESAIGARTSIHTILDVRFVDDKIGYVAGINTDFGEDNTIGNGFIVRTTDGGSTWQALRFSGKRNIPFVSTISIYPTGQSVAYFVTKALEIYKHECTLNEPGISVAGMTRFPEGDSARLNARSGVAYTWSTGDTTQNITARHSGRYNVRVVLAGGCVVNDTVMLTVDAAVKAGPIAIRDCFYDCGPAAVNEPSNRAVLAEACDGKVNAQFLYATNFTSSGATPGGDWKAPNVRAAAIDNDGNTYLLVHYDSFSTLLAKINWRNEIEWTHDFNDVPLYPTFLLALDQERRPVVSLSEWVPEHQAFDLAVTRLTPEGQVDFRRTYQHKAGTTVTPVDLRLGADGSISVVATMNNDLVAVDYTADGTQSPARAYSRSGKSREEAHSLARGSDDEVVVAGLSYDTGDTSIVVAALARSGSARWTWSSRVHDDAIDIRIDSTPDGGTQLVVVRLQYSSDSLLPAVIRFDRNGKIAWSRRVTSDTIDYQAVRLINQITASHVDRFGNTYIAGQARGSFPGERFRIMRFDNEGRKRWEYLSANGGIPLQILSGKGAYVYVAARLGASTNQCSLLRFDQLENLSSVAEQAASPALRSGLRAWPNPASENVSLEYRLEKPGDITLDLFDASGALVRHIDHGVRRFGTHTVTIDCAELPTGNYLACLATASGSESISIEVRGYRR